jgi:hypothetical protein
MAGFQKECFMKKFRGFIRRLILIDPTLPLTGFRDLKTWYVLTLFACWASWVALMGEPIVEAVVQWEATARQYGVNALGWACLAYVGLAAANLLAAKVFSAAALKVLSERFD